MKALQILAALFWMLGLGGTATLKADTAAAEQSLIGDHPNDGNLADIADMLAASPGP